MTTDLAFHYPPDVFDAVVDAVTLLTRGKHDVVMFFRACSVDRAFLAGIDRRIDAELRRAPDQQRYHSVQPSPIWWRATSPRRSPAQVGRPWL